MPGDEIDRQELTRLRQLVVGSFDLEELRVLCFDMGVDYEDLAGNTKTAKMQGLIMYLQRRGELHKLLEIAVERRPRVDWLAFGAAAPSTKEAGGKGDESDSYLDEKTGLELIRIPAGSFIYGEGWKEMEKFLPDYWISKTPVTHENYAHFVGDTGYKPPEHWQGNAPPVYLAKHPVVNVSWDDAAAYAEWANMQLPTEEEWEKAARGTDGRVYPWGHEWKPYANIHEAGIGETTPVGYYSPFGDSPYGCVDMIGNVWEWTNSWRDEDEKYRVSRGSSWDFNQSSTRVSGRYNVQPDFRRDSIGFRVVSLGGSGS